MVSRIGGDEKERGNRGEGSGPYRGKMFEQTLEKKHRGQFNMNYSVL